MMRLFRLILAAALAAPATAVAQTGAPAPAPVRLAEATIARVPMDAPDPARDSAIGKLQAFLQQYPNSPLRPRALFELGELLVQQADANFNDAQRAATASGDTTAAARANAPSAPDYGPAIARYEELVRNYPSFDRIDAAAYTLGTLYATDQRYEDAARMFELVVSKDSSTFRPEAYFRLGDAEFEIASREKGDPRRAEFAKSADAYEHAVAIAPHGGDIYFLALYKLGWAYYNQATQTNEDAYRNAVNVFGRLVAAYDSLTPAQQSRLGLRGEAIEYMAVAFTQVGGAQAAQQYFSQHGGTDYQLTVLKRVAASLRDQGEFPQAVDAYRAVLRQAPTDSAALAIQEQIVDIYQNRMIEPDSAQAARLALVRDFAPGSAWAQANPGLADSARVARESALRQSGQYVLAKAQQSNDRAQYAQAAQLYQQYLNEFASADSAQRVNLYYAEALFGQGNYSAAGAQYLHAAFGYGDTTSAGAQEAARNAIVAYDSALVRNKSDRGVQDSLFLAVDRYVAAWPNSDIAKKALIEEAKRASETKRWDVMAAAFRNYAQRYPNDPYTPTAQKLIGDALYEQGQYAEAQQQWEQAQQVAQQSGRRALADSIAAVRTTAAASFADTLIRRGEYKRAAEEVYVAYADKNPKSDKAPDALRNAIETYMMAADSAQAHGDNGAATQARQRAVDLANRLVSQYPGYKYRLQYQALAANELAKLGNQQEAIAAFQRLVADNPNWNGRPDAMIHLAALLDSAGQHAQAAQTYAQFASSYPRDKRAAGALYNAGVTYLQAGDTTHAAQTLGEFASRFPRDSLAASARQQQVALLRASGDTSAANAQLARLCSGNAGDLRATCAAQEGQRWFNAGVARFPDYQSEQLVIPSVKQLTRSGVQRASARKQQLLKAMTADFKRAIESGNPQYLAAATYYVGLAQWDYGDFLKNAQLPEGLTDAQRQQAQQGAAQQAQQFYDAARQTWQSLLDKAKQDTALANDPGARPWLDRTKDALNGNVPSTPPTSAIDDRRTGAGRIG